MRDLRWVVLVAGALASCHGAPAGPGAASRCSERGAECGTVEDGEGGTVECGDCAPPLVCGGGGQPGRCAQPDQCVPTSCEEQGVDCGEIQDGCGETLPCGEPCCTPQTCEELGVACGEISDGCGHMLGCGEPCAGLRRADPVVLRGSSFAGLEGTDVGAIRLYRYTGGRFDQIQGQVDERLNRTMDFSFDAYVINSPELSYVYDQWGPGQRAEEDGLAHLVDGDDEVVFTADSAGLEAPVSAWVSGADETRYEVTLRDPLDGSTGSAYLFTFSDGGAPDPLPSHVAYTARGRAGAEVATPVYELGISAPWVLDVLRVAGGDDLIDRLKGRAFELVDGETEDLWGMMALPIGYRSGPVRSIREIMGAASGVTTTYITELYRDRIRMTFYLRVHEMMDIWQYTDFDSRRGEMTYSDNVLSAPVAIDGRPDGLSPELRTYTQVDSTAGTLVQLFEVVDTAPLLNGVEEDMEFFFVDSAGGVGPGLDDGTGDDQPAAWGAHGLHILSLCMPASGAVAACAGNDPMASPCCIWTMPSGETFSTGSYFHPLVYRTTWIPLAPGDPQGGAELRRQLDAPLEVQVTPQRAETH